MHQCTVRPCEPQNCWYFAANNELNESLIPILMKRSIFLLTTIALASFGSFVSAKAADTYNIDPAHSTVGFSVQHMVISTVHGKFNEFTGTVTVDGKKIE